jgi:GNAT superfamily N-acetyltransferase
MAVAVVLLSEHPEHVAASRRLLEAYLRLPDAWQRLGGAPHQLPDVFEREIAEFPGAAAAPRGDVVVATSADEVVAAGHIVPLDDSRCEFKRVFVEPEQRGRGIAAQLAEVMLRRGRALGYDHVALDVMPERTNALALWTAMGFRSCPPYRKYGFEMAFMTRRLPELR